MLKKHNFTNIRLHQTKSQSFYLRHILLNYQRFVRPKYAANYFFMNKIFLHILSCAFPILKNSDFSMPYLFRESLHTHSSMRLKISHDATVLFMEVFTSIISRIFFTLVSYFNILLWLFWFSGGVKFLINWCRWLVYGCFSTSQCNFKSFLQVRYWSLDVWLWCLKRYFLYHILIVFKYLISRFAKIKSFLNSAYLAYLTGRGTKCW